MSSLKLSHTLDYISFLTNEELFDVFCQNKSKISTIRNPVMFLRHLKDNGCITDDRFQKFKNCCGQSDIYDVLECVEEQGKQKVRKFWECVDQEHILQHYPELSELTATLKNSLQSELNNETRKRSEDQDTVKERVVKMRKTEDKSMSPQAGPSSQSTYKQKNYEDEESEDEGSGVEESEEEENLWEMPKYKTLLPVKCGKKKAFLHRKALRNYDEKKECIKYRGKMIAPNIFEELGGKEKCKNWKKSITCQGKTISYLLKKGVLQISVKKKSQ